MAARAVVNVMGQSGLAMLRVSHLVEVRAARQEVAGRMCDVWVAEGSAHRLRKEAEAVAYVLRTEGFTVRVRPILG